MVITFLLHYCTSISSSCFGTYLCFFYIFIHVISIDLLWKVKKIKCRYNLGIVVVGNIWKILEYNSCYWPSVLHLEKPWKFNFYSSLVIFVLPVCFWIHMRGQEKYFSLKMYELENRNNWLIDLYVWENLTRTSKYFAVIYNASTGYTSVNQVHMLEVVVYCAKNVVQV